jgi:hypothetical protein
MRRISRGHLSRGTRRRPRVGLTPQAPQARRSTITDPTEYPAPKEQMSPRSPGAMSSEYFEKAMIEPAEEVLA